MSSRPPAPGCSLAERYPTIAASWDHEANGELTPADVAAQAGVVVHWRCAAGHRWSEKVAQRTKDAQWKEGDPAACRLCSGHYIEVEFKCGHALTILAWRAPSGDHPCPDCRQAVYEAKRVAYEQNRHEVLAACRADASPLADALWRERGYDRLAVPLHKRALTKLRGAITYSLVGERAFGSDPISPKLMQTLYELDQLLRAPDDCADGPVMILGEAFWGRALSGEAQPLAAVEVETIASLEIAAVEALESPSLGDPARVPDQTWWLTLALKDWSHLQGWRPYRELRLPLGDERESGRLDLVVFRPGLPELVVEIDSRTTSAPLRSSSAPATSARCRSGSAGMQAARERSPACTCST